MKTLQKFGAFAALYMAVAHLIGIVIFLVILDYLSITDPAQIFQAMLLGSWLSENGGKKLGGFTAHANQQDLVMLKALVEAGKVAPVIDKRYTLPEASAALRYLGTGHARGKVVITVKQGAAQ